MKNFLSEVFKKKRASKIKFLRLLYLGRESNPHVRRHWILNPARLPVPPPRHNHFNLFRTSFNFSLPIPISNIFLFLLLPIEKCKSRNKLTEKVCNFWWFSPFQNCAVASSFPDLRSNLHKCSSFQCQIKHKRKTYKELCSSAPACRQAGLPIPPCLPAGRHQGEWRAKVIIFSFHL